MSATETSFAPLPGSSRRLTTVQAMVAGIATEMDADPEVLDLETDVGAHGGSVDSITGLLERFGRARVLDSPIGEPAFIGLAIGPEHSRCLWGTYALPPGTKVVAPSNPYDAKGLMISAIRDDNPVVYLLHKGMLGQPRTPDDPYATAEVPDAAYEVPIGRAAVARSGTDVTVVTLSRSVHHTLEVAGALSGQDIDVEVIDLRSLVPLDRHAIVDSVARTGRLVVVDEDYLSYGVSGEVAATVTDVDPSLLRAPVQRIAHPDSPTPHAPELERAVLPGTDRIEAAIRRVLAT